MEQLNKLTAEVDGTFKACGILYGYIDADNKRTVYEMTTKAKMIEFNLIKVGTRLTNIVSFFEKQSRIDRVNKYIVDGIEDKKLLGDRNFLL